MGQRFWSFVALLLTALALGLTWAHVLELPQKMSYDAELYSAVNTTMYRYFAVIGAPISIAAILSTALLTFFSRGDRVSFRWSLAATVLLVLWLASWFVIVAPVNNQIAAALTTDPAGVPDLWLRLRPRWEGGHALGFALELAGFSALAISVVSRHSSTGTE